MRSARVILAVVVLAALAAVGCARGPSDTEIATQIKARMFSDAQLKAANISISVASGEVTLAGELPSDGARYAAFKLAAETQGVLKVHDQMSVKVAVAEPAVALAPPPEPKLVRAAAPRRPAARQAAEKVEAPAESRAIAQAEPAPLAAPAPVPAAPPEPPKPRKVTVPAGTVLEVRMIDSIDSETAQPGQTFRASLDAPILADGEEVIPHGADVTVRLEDARSAGRMTGRAELSVALAYLEFQGRRYALNSNIIEREGRSEGKRTAATVGGTTAAGAIIGAIAGGGKGAAIGAIAGAGAGTAASAATKGKQIKIASESLLEFRLEAPVTVTIQPEKAGAGRN